MPVFNESEFLRSVLNIIITICLCLGFCGVLCFVILYIKHILMKIQYSNIPGPKFGLFDFLGGVRSIPWTKRGRNGYSIHALVLQAGEAYCRMFPKEPLFRGWFGFQHLACANKPEVIQKVLSDSSWKEKPFVYKFFEDFIGQGLLTSNGEKWRARRRMMNPFFNLQVLRDFLPVYNEHSVQLVSLLQEEADGRVIELIKPISLCILDIVGETILGTKLKAQENGSKDYILALRSVTDGALGRVITPWLWTDFIFRLTKTGKKFYRNVKIVRELTRSIFLQKKKAYQMNKGDCQNNIKSIMDQLLVLHMEQNKITEDGVSEEVETFVVAGNETTTAAIVFTLYLLGLHKDIQSKVQEEQDRIIGQDKQRLIDKEDLAQMSYLDCVIKESLRLYPAVPAIIREVPKNKTLNGYKLPPGSMIVVAPYIVHKDPEIYPNPEIFDPTRFFPENAKKRHPYAYLPFSTGPRNCIGQLFAVLEIKVVLSHLMRNFTIESLDPRDKVIILDKVSLYTESDIRFKIHPRS